MSVMSKISWSCNKRPDVAHEVSAPTQRKKKVKASNWEQRGPAEGGPVDLELIPSYGGPVVGPIWRGQDRGLLKCRSRYMAITGWNLTDAHGDLGLAFTIGGINASELHSVAISSPSTLSSVTELPATYIFIFTFSAWIYMYFPMFALAVRLRTQACKPYIQQHPMLGYKNEHKLLDICLRVDMMTADEVRWIPYKTQEIRHCWISTWHKFIAYFDWGEPYILDRVVRQFGFRHCIPAHPIRPQEARRPANNEMYVLRNLFVEALWLEAPSHLLTESWTSVPAIPPSSCTEDYMDWFLLRSHRGYRIPQIFPVDFTYR
ncbi:hypothetical protein M9H77_04003 [Catharanthus roseus]|uniref:Uncharacterized protein n=1 Tax=Catharanthus roseus TaxID=4058 RepID=A0ACC0CCW3_CATRO|nr:hypothetical protein M9H77_04003 [Catharanthus roseus]